MSALDVQALRHSCIKQGLQRVRIIARQNDIADRTKESIADIHAGPICQRQSQRLAAIRFRHQCNVHIIQCHICRQGIAFRIGKSFHNRVMPIRQDIMVVTRSTNQDIITSPANQQIVSVMSNQSVVPAPPSQSIVAGTPIEPSGFIAKLQIEGRE